MSPLYLLGNSIDHYFNVIKEFIAHEKKSAQQEVNDLVDAVYESQKEVLNLNESQKLLLKNYVEDLYRISDDTMFGKSGVYYEGLRHLIKQPNARIIFGTTSSLKSGLEELFASDDNYRAMVEERLSVENEKRLAKMEEIEEFLAKNFSGDSSYVGEIVAVIGSLSVIFASKRYFTESLGIYQRSGLVVVSVMSHFIQRLMRGIKRSVRDRFGDTITSYLDRLLTRIFEFYLPQNLKTAFAAGKYFDKIPNIFFPPSIKGSDYLTLPLAIRKNFETALQSSFTAAQNSYFFIISLLEQIQMEHDSKVYGPVFGALETGLYTNSGTSLVCSGQEHIAQCANDLFKAQGNVLRKAEENYTKTIAEEAGFGESSINNILLAAVSFIVMGVIYRISVNLVSRLFPNKSMSVMDIFTKITSESLISAGLFTFFESFLENYYIPSIIEGENRKGWEKWGKDVFVFMEIQLKVLKNYANLIFGGNEE
jgi:hypothetical protein